MNKKLVKKMGISFLALSMCGTFLSDAKIVNADTQDNYALEFSPLKPEERTITRTITIFYPDTQEQTGRKQTITQKVTFSRTREGVCEIKTDPSETGGGSMSGAGGGGAGGAGVGDQFPGRDRFFRLAVADPSAESTTNNSTNPDTSANIPVVDLSETTDPSSEDIGDGICYIDYGSWTVLSGNNIFSKYEAPVIAGYKADIAVVPEITVTPDSSNSQIEIRYTEVPKAESKVPDTDPSPIVPDSQPNSSEKSTPDTIPTPITNTPETFTTPTVLDKNSDQNQNPISITATKQTDSKPNRNTIGRNSSITNSIDNKASKTVEDNNKFNQDKVLPQTSQKAGIFLTIFGVALTGLATLLWFTKKRL